MIIIVELHCNGFQRPCSSSISTHLKNAIGETTQDFMDGALNVTVPGLIRSAQQGDWDIRPVALDTETGPSEELRAYCRDCAYRMRTWAAQKVSEQWNRQGRFAPNPHAGVILEGGL